MTEQGKENIRKARLGKKHSPLTKSKISQGMLRYWQNKKRLEDAEFLEFISIEDNQYKSSTQYIDSSL